MGLRWEKDCIRKLGGRRPLGSVVLEVNFENG